jgi:radical SAM protein (TIGR01212 family)
MRYRRLKDYWWGLRGGRLQKVSLHAGFTCPNRDGTIGHGGCVYCSNEAFTPAYCHEANCLEEQITAGLAFMKARYPRARGFLGYLQAFTGSHACLEDLVALYERLLGHPGLCGLVIGTRPDCLPDPLLEWLARARNRRPVYLEIGIESFSDETLHRMKRGHTAAQAEDAVHRAASHGIPVGGHFLIGFPGEDWKAFFNEVERFNALPLHSVKLHQLQVFRDTPLAAYYRNHPEAFHFPEKGEYLEAVAAWLTRIRPDVHIDRIAGEAPPRHILNPSWNTRIDQLAREFEQLLDQKDIIQGEAFTPCPSIS